MTQKKSSTVIPAMTLIVFGALVLMATVYLNTVWTTARPVEILKIRVVTPERVPVPELPLTLTQAGQSEIQQIITITDKKGWVYFYNIPPGQYEISIVTAHGTETSTYQIESAKEKIIDIISHYKNPSL